MTRTAPPADEALEGFHQAVLDGLPEAVIVAAPDGVITFVNAATERLLGYPASDVAGKSITVLVPRDPGRRADPVKWLARWAAEPDVEHSRFVDLVARRRDGSELHVEVRVRAGMIWDRPRFFISVRDNTERRREQAESRSANLRAARILMVAEDAIVSIDADQRITLFNPAAEQMFGYSAEEAVGKPLALLIPDAVRRVHARHVEAFRGSKQPSRHMSERKPVTGVRRNGEVFPLEATITKVMAAGAQTYTAHLRDVTERNRAREKLQRSEAQIRAVFDHATEAIALLTRDGDIVEINRAAEALTETGHSVIGRPLWEAPWLGAQPAAGPGVDRLRKALETAAGGHAARTDVELSRDGQPLPITVHFTPIKGPDGGIEWILAEGRFEG
jgi:PAS domain S-box-containing protein